MNRLLQGRWLVAAGAVAIGAGALTTWKRADSHSTTGPSTDTAPLTVDCSSDGTFVHGLAPHPKLLERVEEGTPIRAPSKASSGDWTCGSVERSRRLVQRTMLEQGIPGAVVTVAKDGRTVWSEGLGYADVENGVPCTPETVMRIASISKPMAAVALMQLWRRGLVDLDAPIQTYVPEFPRKEFEGNPVDITTRQLLSHLGGIRSYRKKAGMASIL